MDGMENLMPREKMLQYGIETLTDVELLALFCASARVVRMCSAMPSRYYSVLAHSTLCFLLIKRN